MNGILNVKKEIGYTSHDVINRLRRICNQKKIGHTGTLDPNAEGVLPVCFGNATKVCGLLTDTDKCYRAEIILGLETDSYDITGNIVFNHQERIKNIILQTANKSETENNCIQNDFLVTETRFRQVVNSFQGNQMQVPPMYSARKVNGKKLYQLARQGITIEREAKKIIIYRIDILSINIENGYVQSAVLEIECSKGTYIRSICHDIGQILGIGACMGSLTRTCVGRFLLKDSLTLNEIEQEMIAGKLEQKLIPADRMFSYPKLQIHGDEQAKLLRNGNKIPLELLLSEMTEKLINENNFLVYDTNGRFTAIYEHNKQRNELVPLMMFPE